MVIMFILGTYHGTPELRVLTCIRHRFGEKWHHVGLRLGLDDATLNIIKLNNPLIQERAFEMLKRWLEVDTKSCYCKIISQLIAEDLNTVAEDLKQFIKNQ